MTQKEKFEVLKAKRLYEKTLQLIENLEADGIDPNHEVFDHLAGKVEEQMEHYNKLVDSHLENPNLAMVAGICLN